MGTLKGFAVRLRALARRRATDVELDEQIRLHLELETEKNVRLGMSADDARRRALVDFGGVQRTVEDHRDARGGRWAEDIVADTRFALRTRARSPALSGAAVLTLALGVGANTAIFSAVNAVILRPLPFAAPDRLMMLWEENPEKGWHMNIVAPANYLDWREQVPAFQDVAAYTAGGSLTLTGDGPPRLVRSASVTGSFFSVLGVRPESGRALRDEETWATGSHVAVVSHRLWRDQLRGDPRIVGRTIQLDGLPVQVVGVMPESFAFPAEGIDVWSPVEWKATDRAQVWFRRAHWLRAVARLRSGIAPEQANAQFQQVVDRLKVQYPQTNKYMGAGMTPLHAFLVGDTRRPLFVLLVAVALLLLIACANVGNLLLVQAAQREREVALRLALGAGRGRLVRQALTESLVLSGMGGIAGLAVGWWGARAMVALEPPGMLRVSDLGMDRGVLGYVLAITTASGLLFGIAPAVWSGRRAPADALREGGRTGSEGRRMRRWGDTLVIGEVALALLLTVGAGLLVRSFWELRHVDPGFDPNGVLTVSLELPGGRYDTGDKIAAFFGAVVVRVRALPGAADVAVVRQLPLDGGSWTSDFTVAGGTPGEFGTELAHREISPDYFRTMRVPLLRGRAFTAADQRNSPRVVIINDALARSYFRDRDPIGQLIAFDKVPDSTSVWRTIVGVVGSEHQNALDTQPQIEIFAPFTQDRTSGMVVVVRVRGATDPTSLAPAVRRVVADLDPTLAIASVRTMTEVRATSLARERFLMALMIVFAVVGLLLAVVGVYGVLAQLARRRTREMGIRIALGAQGSQVRWLVVRHGLWLTSVGVVIGALAALATTRALSGLLFRIPAADPLTFAAVATLLATTSIVASWLPARKASRADPAEALREV